MAQDFVVQDSNELRRRFLLFLVDVDDMKTPELGEATGQPHISINGRPFVNTNNVLVAIGFGLYFVTLTPSEISEIGKIVVHYVSVATLDFHGIGVVYQFDIYSTRIQRIDQGVDWIRWNIPNKDEAQVQVVPPIAAKAGE